MKYALSLLMALLLFGCSDTKSNPETDGNDTITPLADNPLYEQQWSINPDINFYTLHGIDPNAHINPEDILTRYSGSGIKVAVIDDGFDTAHVDLKDNIIATASVLPTSLVISDVSHSSAQDYHGTAVAGIIGAKNNTLGILGVASNVKLILIKIPMETYTDAAGIKAFDVAKQYGADIICCSWGTGDVSDAVKAKITEVANNGRGAKGTLIVFASGNDNALMLNDESSIDSVLGVGATDDTNLRTTYSNFGPQLDIMAPGGLTLGISTLDPSGTSGASVDGYNRFNELRSGLEVSFIGTSASAPILSGILALALEANPELTRTQLFEILKNSTSHIGQNVPYLYEMIRSHSATPTISGTFGSSGYSEFQVQLIAHDDQSIHGPYPISSIGNNEWSATVTDILNEGYYSIQVVALDASYVFATDESFEINLSSTTLSNKNVKKNDFYGYGKIDLAKLIVNSL